MVGLRAVNFVVSESDLPAGLVSVARSSTDDVPLDVVLVIDRSARMSSHRDAVVSVVDEMYRQIGDTGQMRIVSIGENPVLEVAPARPD